MTIRQLLNYPGVLRCLYLYWHLNLLSVVYTSGTTFISPQSKLILYMASAHYWLQSQYFPCFGSLMSPEADLDFHLCKSLSSWPVQGFPKPSGWLSCFHRCTSVSEPLEFYDSVQSYGHFSLRSVHSQTFFSVKVMKQPFGVSTRRFCLYYYL